MKPLGKRDPGVFLLYMPGWRNGRRKGLKKLSLQEETPEVDALKFGETLTGNAEGNPEPSPDPKGSGKV